MSRSEALGAGDVSVRTMAECAERQGLPSEQAFNRPNSASDSMDS
jgi:hypothetical protein